jgi:RHS repeat-associated protein
VQYHLGDHLGGSAVVLDAAGAAVSREEYTPYGDTSFGSHALKRYRYAGKERDEESGLYYVGSRYYAPWLARWTSPDPAGPVDGPNLYAAFRGNPVTLRDPTGTQSEPGAQTASNIEVVGDGSADRYHFNVNRSEITSGMVDGVQTVGVTDYGTVEEVFEPAVSVPEVKDRVLRQGRLEGQDVVHTFKGMWNGVGGDWLGLPKADVDPRYEGADLIGKHLAQNLALEGAGAVVAKVGGRLLEAIRPARAAVGAQAKASVVAPEARLTRRTVEDFMDVARQRIRESNHRYGSSAQDIYASAAKGKATKAVQKSGSGPFSIIDWSGYPPNCRPPGPGPFRLVDAEYEAAKAAKQAVNKALRKKHAKFFGRAWADIHEPHPIKFGGSPTDMNNKEILSPPDHWEVTAWWNDLMRWVEGG